jgi:PAS domain S-box-containing protein
MSATTETSPPATDAAGNGSRPADEIRRAERRRRDRRLRFTLVGFLCVAFVAIVLTQIFSAIGARRDAHRASIALLEHLARVTDAHLMETFRSIELVMMQVDEFIDSGPMRSRPPPLPPADRRPLVIAPIAPFTLPPGATGRPPPGDRGPQGFLRSRRDMAEQIHRITVFDPAGNAVADTSLDRYELQEIRNGRRPQLPTVSGGAGPRVRIGRIVNDPNTGTPVLPVARTITADGYLHGGTIVAALDISYLLRFLRAVDPTGAAAEVILYAHGAPFLRYPGLYPMDHPVRDAAGVSALFERLMRGERETTALGPFDGIERTYVHRTLHSYGVMLAIGVDRAASLTPWQSDLAADLAKSGALALVVLALGAMVFAQLRQRDRSEQALADSERNAQRLAMVAERTMSGVVIVDAAGRIEWVNKGLQSITGIEAGWIVGEPFVEWLAWMARQTQPSFDLSRALDVHCQTMAGDEERWLRILVDPVFGSTQTPQAWVGIITDITEQRQLELDMTAARDAAEQANRAKSEFLANMSHELRTPLNAVIGFSEIMCKEMFGALGSTQYREYANHINASGKHLLALINDILDLTKVEAQKLTLNEDLVDLEALLDESLAGLSVLAQNGKVTLERIDGTPTPLVTCDQRAMRQVVYNLLSNAVKFTPEDGTVSAGLSHCADGAVELTICDTGIGIPADHLPRLMQPFEQVRGGFSREKPGTGLGLALTRKLVELHGGAIHIDSVEGEGTTVTVRLPAERVGEAEVPAVGAAA